MDITLGTTTRRRLLTTGLLHSLAIAVLPAAMLVQNAEADKKKKKKKIASVSDREQAQRDLCESGGGQLAVLDGPNGGNTTECKGGSDNGYTCYNTKNSTTCTQGRTQSPLAPVTDGNEQPYDDGTGTGGDLPWSTPDPSAPIIVAERHVAVDADDARSKAKGKRHRNGLGKARKR